MDHFAWVGTADPAAYFSVNAAIEFQKEHHWHEVRDACHKMAVWAAEEISGVAGTPRICSDDGFIQMCSIELPAGSFSRLGTQVWDDYRVEVPLVRWNGRELLRISIQAYNKAEDVERLRSALKDLL